MKTEAECKTPSIRPVNSVTDWETTWVFMKKSLSAWAKFFDRKLVLSELPFVNEYYQYHIPNI